MGGGVEKRMSSRKEGDEGETFTEQRLDMDVTLCAGKVGRDVEMG